MRALPLVVATILAIPTIRAQSIWRAEHALPSTATNDFLSCWNDADGRVFVACRRLGTPELETWERNGGGEWHRRRPAHSPPAREGFVIAYDSHRSVVVLFGGFQRGSGGAITGYLADTWEWDGLDWSQRQPTAAPPARGEAGLAFDSARQRTVLFGGADPTALDDTWEWDGSTWSQRLQPSGVAAPVGRKNMAIAFDSTRGVTVMFGGGAALGGVASDRNPLDDLWEWDGVQWTERLATSGPPRLHRASMAFDSTANAVTLYGGQDQTAFFDNGDLWSWDGMQWSRAIPAATARPIPTYRVGLVDDRRRGELVSLDWSGTWTWDPTALQWNATAGQSEPWAGDEPLVAYGFDRTSLYSTQRGTWEWSHDELDWTELSNSATPADFRACMTFDAARQHYVLFQPAVFSTQSETWIWDRTTGGGWQLANPSQRPGQTSSSSLAFDVGRGSTLLFGGFGAAGPTNETWTWDGSDWSLRSPTQSPPPRYGASMAYDFLTDRVVLFGGTVDGVVGRNDVWEWDGVDWTQRPMNASPAPMPRWGAGIASRADGLVVVGGYDVSFRGLAEAWALRGTTWTPLSSVDMPEAGAAAVTSDLLEITLFSGITGSPGIGIRPTGAWLFGAIQRALAIPVGTGCGANPGSNVELSVNTLPRLREANFELTATGLPSAQPAAFLFGATPGLFELSGCRLFVPAPFVSAGTTTQAGGSALVLPISGAEALLGLDLWAQTIALDPGSTRGFALSSALRLRVGL